MDAQEIILFDKDYLYEGDRVRVLHIWPDHTCLIQYTYGRRARVHISHIWSF